MPWVMTFGGKAGVHQRGQPFDCFCKRYTEALTCRKMAVRAAFCFFGTVNGMASFSSKGFGQIRVLQENGKCLFCSADAAKSPGYSNPETLCEDIFEWNRFCSKLPAIPSKPAPVRSRTSTEESHLVQCESSLESPLFLHCLDGMPPRRDGLPA